MTGLPTLPNSDGITKSIQVQFAGYNHNLGAGDGTLWDMENLTSDYAPLLGSRRPRKILRTLTRPHALYAHDGLFWVDGDGFYADGVRKGTVTEGEKEIISLQMFILIFPDKKYYRTDTGEFGGMEAQWSGTVTIGDGTYADQEAKANTIRTTGSPFPFDVGDGVTITGSTPGNNKCAVVEEISDDKRELRFLENCFEEGTWTGSVTLTREVPDMDFLCENENRVWGCKGDTIYASALGRPFSWMNLGTLATDAWAVDVGSAGDFTGCCSYMGYPIFFKEDAIYKVYGDKPSNFQTMTSARLGVEKGSHKSLAVAGERLYYLSRAGIVSYAGGTPENISGPFGMVRFKNAVAGSDGRKYYVSMEGPDGVSLFVFDTQTGLWHREDDTRAVGFAWNENLYVLAEDGTIFLTGILRDAPGEEEATFESFAEFGDFTERAGSRGSQGEPNKKGLSRLQIRLELEAGAQVALLVKFDSEEWEDVTRYQKNAGQWERVRTLTADRKRSFVLPIIPRRCDHWRLRIQGRGQWRLYSMSREYYKGSDLQ